MPRYNSTYAYVSRFNPDSLHKTSDAAEAYDRRFALGELGLETKILDEKDSREAILFLAEWIRDHQYDKAEEKADA